MQVVAQPPLSERAYNQLVVIVTVDNRIVNMPNGQRKGSACASETISESLNGDMIENNDPIIATVVESISQAIIARLIDNTNFTKKKS